MTDSTGLARELGAALGDGYVVGRPLGEGGFAVVFLVNDLGLKRDLAVKVLSPEMLTSKHVLERFRREAETVARLSHPNIVPLHFIGQKESLVYLAMQCVHGGSIADRLQREGTLPVNEVVRVMSEVASALAHAHKNGIIHRDIKPANVLVDADSGRSLVTDFGIARSGDAKGLTATGLMLGTPAYLSPEQVTGETLDHRVDIYALGVMAYEMLAGHVPFDGATPTAAMLMRLAGPPVSVATLRPDVPTELADVITKCLAANRAERYESAADVIRALNGEMTTTGGRTTRTFTVDKKAEPEKRRGSRNWISLAVALVLLIPAIGLVVSRQRNTNASVAPSNAASNAQATSAATAVDTNLVAIPAGEYVIGDDRGPVIVRPKHVVRVDAFRIERTEVTVDAYNEFVAAKRAAPPWGAVKPLGTLPVTRVRWGDAANYCALRYAGRGRLPTEAEWEAAARGRAARTFPYGDTSDGANTNTSSAHRDGPVPVGSFPRGATPDGLQDMSGNVWEWTSSPLAAYPGGKQLSDSMSRYRVLRGGAFDTDDSLATGFMRGYLKVSSTAEELPKVGFRCVTPDASPRKP